MGKGHAKILISAGNLPFLIFIIFTSANILGELCVLMKIPVNIGEIIAVALLGTYVLGVIDTSDSVLRSFAEIGVIFLMFYVGLEIRVKDLFAGGRTAILVGLYGDIS